MCKTAQAFKEMVHQNSGCQGMYLETDAKEVTTWMKVLMIDWYIDKCWWIKVLVVIPICSSKIHVNLHFFGGQLKWFKSKYKLYLQQKGCTMHINAH